MRSLLPPQLVAILIVVAVALAWVLPIATVLPGWWRTLGALPILAGGRLAARSAALFERRRTNIHTFRDPDLLVTDGAFGWSRNPMYLGFAVLLVGVALATGALSAWAAPIVFVVVADRWYVAFEEQRLADRFGTDYDAYRSTTRRWVGRS